MSPAQSNSKRNSFKINLLINKAGKSQFQANLIKWLLSSGRYIVVFVEIIVIGAFVFRYKLDAELADLQDEIKEQAIFVESFKDDELLIKQTQFQFSSIKQLRNETPNYVETILRISQLTPKSIRLSSINLDRTRAFPKTELLINGQTPSNLELSAFIKALKKDPSFTDISLTNISFEGMTTFTITGGLNGKGAKSS